MLCLTQLNVLNQDKRGVGHQTYPDKFKQKKENHCKIIISSLKLKADRPHLRYYPYMPPDYTHADKYHSLRALTDGWMDRSSIVSQSLWVSGTTSRATESYFTSFL